jgi:hypothetical protein
MSTDGARQVRLSKGGGRRPRALASGRRGRTCLILSQKSPPRGMDQLGQASLELSSTQLMPLSAHCFRTASQHSIFFYSYLVAFLEDVGNVIAILQAPSDRQNVVILGPGN